MNCSVHKEHWGEKKEGKDLKFVMFVVVSGTRAVFLHLVRHLSGVRDEVQTQLLLAIERRGAHRARVPLLDQTAHTQWS